MKSRFQVFSTLLGLVALGIGIASSFYNAWLVFFPLALWIGWLQVGGL
jgi:hypothetical protein